MVHDTTVLVYIAAAFPPVNLNFEAAGLQVSLLVLLVKSVMNSTIYLQ